MHLFLGNVVCTSCCVSLFLACVDFRGSGMSWFSFCSLINFRHDTYAQIYKIFKNWVLKLCALHFMHFIAVGRSVILGVICTTCKKVTYAFFSRKEGGSFSWRKPLDTLIRVKKQRLLLLDRSYRVWSCNQKGYFLCNRPSPSFPKMTLMWFVG